MCASQTLQFLGKPKISKNLCKSARNCEICSFVNCSLSLLVPAEHLHECPRTRAGKCSGECFSSDFGRLTRSAPKSAPRSGFQNAKKHSSEHSLGDSEPGAQNHSKSALRNTFQPSPSCSPPDGGQDHNASPLLLHILEETILSFILECWKGVV